MGDKIISVYWFAILFIVSAGIVYMVYSFYGAPYDVRSLEVGALNDRVVDCFMINGRLNKAAFDEGLEVCNLNFDVEDIYNWGESGQYFVEVEISEFESGIVVFSGMKGNSRLKEDCEMEGKYFPVCLEKLVYVLDEQGDSYKINIMSVIRKTEKNVQ